MVIPAVSPLSHRSLIYAGSVDWISIGRANRHTNGCGGFSPAATLAAAWQYSLAAG
jgi:hypothetical protein